MRRPVDVTWMGGFVTMPEIRLGCGSKFAIERISEALGKEVAPFGVRTIALAPGQFRTDRAGSSMDRTPHSIPDYDGVMDPIRATRQANGGARSGDADEAAQASLRVVEAEYPAVRRSRSEDALELVASKPQGMEAEVATWDAPSPSTSFAA